MADAGFGAGLGTFIGAEIGASDLSKGLDNINNTANSFKSTVAPYDEFGQSFLPAATDAAGKVTAAAGNVKGYDQFMADYKTSPGAQYTMDQADEGQNAKAGSVGKLLSGGNARALSTVNEGIASTFANQAYGQYLAGNQQQFGQLESSLGSMFKAIGIGETATGQEAGVTSSQIAGQTNIAGAQAKNDQAKGSGLGSMFGGIGSLTAAF